MSGSGKWAAISGFSGFPGITEENLKVSGRGGIL